MNKFFTAAAALLLVTASSFGAAGNQQFQKTNKVTLYHENDIGVPTYVSGEFRTKIAKGFESAAALDYFNEFGFFYKMNNPAEELRFGKTEVDQIGMSHLRVQQQYDGLTVIGGDMTVHFTNDGTLKTINGTYTPIKELNTKPDITSSLAISRAQDDLLVDFGEGTPGDAELVVFPWEKETYLCWRFFIYSDVPMGRWEYLIDAHTGDIVFKANRIMNAEAVGSGTGVMGIFYNHIDTWDNGSTFEMIDYTRRANNDIHGHGGLMGASSVIRTYLATTSLPGSVATDADNSWSGTTISPAVDGHMYSALFYDWVLREFGRNSYNDNGATMNTSVNYSAEGDNNAYWNGSQIVIWSWGTGWRSLAGCPDVIAHEWGHAITETTSGLVYQLESGALNESFSDMIGAAFEWAHDTIDTPDWQMGENGRLTGEGFRDMEDPHSKGDPDTYGTGDPYWIDVVGCSPSYWNDYCGVHTNSGVGNKWYSLLSDGGIHNGVTVNGLNYDTAMQIAFRANAYYWNSGTNYHEAAIGTISAAHDLDPSGNWEWDVAQAWNAVGVSTPTPSIVFDFPGGIPKTTTPGAEETFDVVVSGSLGGVPVSGTGEIYISVNGRVFQNQPMTETSPNNYTATLPARVCGDIIEFYFSAELTDPNILIYNASSSNPYKAIPATGVFTIFEDDFETNKGWTISGGTWGRGIPSGSGGEYGNPDPTTGTVGPNVMGYNLSGDYTNSMPEYHVTSPAIDCSTIGATSLTFWRWLGVEQPAYDHAYIRVSTNGSSWTTVWENEQTIEDDSWTEHTIDISSIADGASTVYVRFTMGSTDGGWRYCGWNIDDVRISGTQCQTSAAMEIVQTSLPDWTEGMLINQQLTVTNGNGILTWSDKNGDLSGTGLTLSSSGLLDGVVPASQMVSFTAMVIDETPDTAEQAYTFTINSTPTITTPSLPDWTAGHAFSQQLSAVGGTGVLSFFEAAAGLSGTGLTLSTSGLVSGTPVAGPVSFWATVTDTIGATSQVQYSFTINPAVDVAPASLPDWTDGVAFSQQLTISGGTGALSVIDKNNDLTSSGLTLSSTGLLSGTPVAGTYNFTCQATDDLGAVDEEPMSIIVNAPLQFATTSLADWTFGIPVLYNIQTTGGTNNITIIDKNNDLSGSGMAIAANGQMSGTPADTGTYSFTAQATDEVGAVTELLFSLHINPAVEILTTSLPNAQIGVAYSQQIDVFGGSQAIYYNDMSGTLASYGLGISETGIILGTPTSIGVVNFTIQALDIPGSEDQQALTLIIELPYICGDVDGSGSVDVADLVYTVEYMFGDPAGPAPTPMEALDADGNGMIDIADVVHLVGFMFDDGPDPICGTTF